MQDFQLTARATRILEIECDFTDDYLIGHARRVGLAGASTPKETLDRLLPTIRYDVTFESDRMRDARLPQASTGSRRPRRASENTVPLAEFLDIPTEKAREIAATDYLFAD